MKKDKKTSKDDIVKKDLQRALDQDGNLRSYHLESDVNQGEAVIQGVVDVLSEKKRAESIARSTPGVKKVDSAISISTDGPITDKDVEMEVAEELSATPGVDPKHIGAKSSHGVVTLVGTTDDADEIKAAKHAAETARGVVSVQSQVRVEEEEMTPEQIFHSQVRNDREKEEKRRPKR